MNKVELVNDFMSMIGRLEWNGEILNENSVLNELDKFDEGNRDTVEDMLNIYLEGKYDTFLEDL